MTPDNAMDAPDIEWYPFGWVGYDDTIELDDVLDRFRGDILKPYEHQEHSEWMSKVFKHKIGVFMVRPKSEDDRKIRIMVTKVPEGRRFPGSIGVSFDRVDSSGDGMVCVSTWDRPKGVWIFAPYDMASMYVRSMSTLADDFRAAVDDGPYRYDGAVESTGCEVQYGNIIRRTLFDGVNLFDLRTVDDIFEGKRSSD